MGTLALRNSSATALAFLHCSCSTPTKHGQRTQKIPCSCVARASFKKEVSLYRRQSVEMSICTKNTFGTWSFCCRSAKEVVAAKLTPSKATKVCDVLRVSIIGDAISLYCTVINCTAPFEKEWCRLRSRQLVRKQAGL